MLNVGTFAQRETSGNSKQTPVVTPSRDSSNKITNENLNGSQPQRNPVVSSRPEQSSPTSNNNDRLQGLGSGRDRDDTKRIGSDKTEITKIRKLPNSEKSNYTPISPPVNEETSVEYIYVDNIVEINNYIEINNVYLGCETIPYEIVNVYPAFPLRFADCEINYLYSKRIDPAVSVEEKSRGVKEENLIKDIYEINVSLIPEKFDYWDMFGILIEIENEQDRLLLFNEDRMLLESGYVFDFSNYVVLDTKGYLKLTVGYYDEENVKFYPAVYREDETSMLIFVD